MQNFTRMPILISLPLSQIYVYHVNCESSSVLVILHLLIKIHIGTFPCSVDCFQFISDLPEYLPVVAFRNII